MYFWGHGNEPYPSNGLSARNGQSWDDVLCYVCTNAKLPYKLALGLIFACDSNSGKSLLMSKSPAAIWHGYTGLLVPLQPSEYTVWNYIKAGDQRTREGWRY